MGESREGDPVAYYQQKHIEWEERKAERAVVREGIKRPRLGWHNLRRLHRVRYRLIKAWKRGTYR